MYLGIDLGTSAVKVVLVDAEQRLLGQSTQSLDVQRPALGHSEQDPHDWWRGTDACVMALRAQVPQAFREVRAIGLSGQMHGATLLDASDRVLRPAILWNDGRSEQECAELRARVPQLEAITGNIASPGFTAPKLLWLKKHEPDTFARVAHVLLPKDYLRLRLSGDYASDLSDASGTSWLDVGKRAWSGTMVEATGLRIDQLPTLYEGPQATGQLLPDLAQRWGLRRDVVIAAGAGDNAAAAIGAGVVQAGQALISLGTSGVYFVSSARFAPNTREGVHAFCHALPATWHQMSVVLSAASCIEWCAKACGAANAATLLAEVEAAPSPRHVPIFLPYLAGERTPHNDAQIRGAFFGLDHDTSRPELARAVLEGISFALADGQDALVHGGAQISQVHVVGGGARSPLLVKLLASALQRPLAVASSAALGPAFGAARLARLSVTRESSDAVCSAPPAEHVIEPDRSLIDVLAHRRASYRALYPAVKSALAATGVTP